MKYGISEVPEEFKKLFSEKKQAVCVWPVAPDNPSIPQWVINKLPKGAPVALRCDDGQWFIDGKPAHDTQYIKTGYMRTNAVALSVRAALWI